MSPGESVVCDYENEAGGISIQEVLGKKKINKRWQWWKDRVGDAELKERNHLSKRSN